MSTPPLPAIPNRVADYARLSEDDAKDPDLRGENVAIQLDECEGFRATRPDWQHIGSFKDNDISASAYSTDERPDFEKLMGLVRRSEVDVILCVEATRLFRKPLEAEILIDLVWSKKTSFYLVATTRGGYYDLRTSVGRKALRDAVNAAAGESDNISDRVRAKKAALARRGMPNGGRRPYGFEADHIAHRPEEIKVMHEMADRVIKGESPNWVFGDMNERGIKTAEGHEWTKGTMVNMLKRKCYAPYRDTEYGIREHHGVEYKAVWKAVFDPVTWHKLQIALRADKAMGDLRGNPREYPGTGFLFCGNCGKKMGGSMKRDRPHLPNMPRYKCKIYDSFGRKTGCGSVTILAVPLEDLIANAIIFRLESADFARIYAEDEAETNLLRAALDDQEAKKQRLDELIDQFYGENPDGLSREQFMRAKASAELALKRAEEEVEKYSSKRAIAGIPLGENLREVWQKRMQDIGWVRQMWGTLIDKVIVHQGGGKPKFKCTFSDLEVKFDPERVEIIWKL